MTTEIAVLNRLGVALATDSAVTISGSGKQKVFDTADKLFELCTSGNDPVGIMINGNMDFLGVPWEVIIKGFREAEREPKPRSMREWLDCVLAYLSSHKAMNEAQEAMYADVIIADEISAIRRRIFRDFRASVGKAKIADFVSPTIQRRQRFYDRSPVAESLQGLTLTSVKKKNRKKIKDAAAEMLSAFGSDPADVEAVLNVVLAALVSSEPSDLSTGIIVAGYRADDMFPSVAMADIDGSLCGLVKYTHRQHLSVDRATNPAKVISFAQTDVVDRILSGADDRFVNESEKYLAAALANAKTSVTDALVAAGMDGALSAGIMDDVIKSVVGKYKKEFVTEARDRFKSDFDEMVAMMPKQDVIELAEALVSITAIERNASSEQATVGGPVDIAFITKYEGFVWIKRKHYFDPDLNPRYFWRKRRIENDAGRAE